MCYTARANIASEWGDVATLARRMHLRKSLISYPLDMDALISILRACRKMCIPIFITGLNVIFNQFVAILALLILSVGYC